METPGFQPTREMTPEQWSRVCEVSDRAIDTDPSERPGLIAELADGDETVARKSSLEDRGLAGEEDRATLAETAEQLDRLALSP